MKCNYKKSLQRKSPTENFIDYVYADACKSYYDEKTETLKPEFYDNFYKMISEENQNRLDKGCEKLITVDMVDEQTAVYFDEAMPRNIDLKTPNDYLSLYAAIHGFMFDSFMSNTK